MAEKRTTEKAETEFTLAFRYMDAAKNRNSSEVQYALYMSMGMRDLSQAIREVYDKLEQIDRKLSTRT